MAIEIVDLPINSRVIFHSFWYVYHGVICYHICHQLITQFNTHSSDPIFPPPHLSPPNSAYEQREPHPRAAWHVAVAEVGQFIRIWLPNMKNYSDAISEDIPNPRFTKGLG